MKDIQIKIWPEIEGVIPSIIPWQNILEKSNELFLDFTDCVSVHSSSLTQLLIKCIKIIESDNFTRRWKSHEKRIHSTFSKVIKLNFFNILDNYSPVESLFRNKSFSNYNERPLIEFDEFGNKVTSFPIYCIDFNSETNRRDSLTRFRLWLRDSLYTYFESYDFNLSQLILILNEIAKNTADHTNGNGFIGIDIKNSNDGNLLKLSFTIGDLGIGINRNIKEQLPIEQIKRYRYWDLTQTYMFALRDYSTTKKNSRFNKGLGMSIITNGSKKIGINLSVYDAKSRGVITRIKNLSHANVRENFFNIGRPVGFYYFGELIAKRVI